MVYFAIKFLKNSQRGTFPENSVIIIIPITLTPKVKSSQKRS